ncbi:MAG TPA: TIGR00266 family protein [Deltaproteobacteria bacterium]|nr:TIGR00266 family protein [Deltaproteobacteria bacterium]
MEIEIRHAPSYALAIVALSANETVVAEGGAMVSMDRHVQIQTAAGAQGGGALAGLARGFKRMLAGETFFQNRFTAKDSAGEVTFAPTHQGDIRVLELNQRSLMLQSSAFLCSGEGVAIDAKWGGARTFFGGEGLIMLRATGSGPIVFNSFGAIHEVLVEDEFIVDTGHIVAFEDSLTFRVSRFGGGWKSFFLGGEGLVCTFSGRGRLWLQTRNTQSYGQLIGRQLPPRQS